MTDQEVIQILKWKIGEGYGAQSEVARELEVSPQYLSDVLKGDKPVSDRILKWLGLERTIVRAK